MKLYTDCSVIILATLIVAASHAENRHEAMSLGVSDLQSPKSGLAICLDSDIEAAILRGGNGRVVYINKALMAFSVTYDYLYLEIGVSYPKAFEGITHYYMVIRKARSAANWKACDVFLAASDIKARFLGRPVAIEDTVILEGLLRPTIGDLKGNCSKQGSPDN